MSIFLKNWEFCVLACFGKNANSIKRYQMDIVSDISLTISGVNCCLQLPTQPMIPAITTFKQMTTLKKVKMVLR